MSLQANKLINVPISTIRYLAREPLLTGPLLYLLTRAPADIRERFLGPLRPYLLSKNADARLATAVRVLKALFVLGIGGRLSQLLDRLAANYWYLRRPGAPWRFGDAQKSELVLVTGGCSGFGFEMVKGFAGKARVICLDISDFPEELARRKSLLFFVFSVELLCADDSNSVGCALLQVRRDRLRGPRETDGRDQEHAWESERVDQQRRHW